MKAIAFYLPQFHATPENDLWWGQGFTEWTNVTSAVPYFAGHYQPHVPHESVGYYDLSRPEDLVRQHRQAYRYGVSAFCYYYYNFNGKTLLEEPLRIMNGDDSLQNEFCLCWANEDWTRAWYGQKKEVLLGQNYSPDHALSFIKAVTPYLKNPRYLRVDNKPLLLVYRPEHNPICLEYSSIWRTYAREFSDQLGFEDFYLVGVEALTHGVPPETYGFDAALEFAPDWTQTRLLSGPDERPRRFDYKATVQNMIAKPDPDYTRFRCIFPGWDNTPRYKQAGVLFDNNSMGVFKYFAEFAVDYTRRKLPDSAQFVFINAWNEWGEGCHLEPDEKHGFLPLQIVRQAFTG